MEEQNNTGKYVLYFFIGLLVIVGFQSVYFLLLKSLYPSLSDRANFADSFGAFNALVSALAFGVLIVAIFLQKRELELQRQELEETREVLKSQQQQLEIQSNNLVIQRFEITFFNLLTHLNSTIDDIPEVWDWDIPSDHRRIVKGRESFIIVYDSLKRRKESKSLSTSEIMGEFNKSLAPKFSSFFEVLFNSLLYLEYSDIKNKHFYYNLVESSLPASAKIITFYIIAFHGTEHFRNLVRSRTFLVDINRNLLFEEKDFELINKQ